MNDRPVVERLRSTWVFERSDFMADVKCRTIWMSEKIRVSGSFWRKSRIAQSFALLSVVALVATGTFAVEDSAKLAGPGLSGIFPSVPPADLSEDEFSKLNGNWADWSKTAASTVADFFAKIDESDVAAQRRGIGILKIKLDVMRRALDDPRYLSLQGPLTALHNSLSLRIDLAEAILDSLEIDSSLSGAEKSKSRSVELLSSISALEKDLAAIANGSLWLPYFKVTELKNALTADPQADATVALAKQSQANLKSRDYLLDSSQKEFTHRPAFESYSGAVNRYLTSIVWVNSADAIKALRAEYKTLIGSLDTYTATGQNAGELRKAFWRVRLASADGGERLSSALQKRIFNYNLRVIVTEDFLNKLMSQSRTESGPVSDFVLGAAVSGNQITNTKVSVNLKPSNTTARFDLQLAGAIHSNTVGVTSQATVYTSGNHNFIATKEINFDGLKFATSPATIRVNPHNTTTGIATNMSGGLFGGIANNIASQKVEEKRGEAEAIAASRVQQGVLPKFDSEANSAFASQGEKLNHDVFGGLRAANLFPDAYSYQTTEQLLSVNARLMDENQVGADQPETSLMSVSGATALLHESLLNNAIDQIGIAGQTLNEAQLREKIEEFVSKAMNKPFKFEAPAPSESAASDEEKGVNAIIFAATDPIRLRFRDDELTIIIRAGFKQEGRDDIPMREVVVPISFEVQGQKILAKRGNVVVSAAEGQGGGISTNAVVRKKIQSVLPDRTLDGKIEIKATEKTVVTHVSKLRFVDGWATISIE